ncbi:MAG: ribbon-helix-helix protein, CopG family [Solirubrobacterales bacterium]
MIDHSLKKKGPAERRGLAFGAVDQWIGFKFCFLELRHLAVTGRVQLKSLPMSSDIVIDMRTISLAVSEKNYELFRELARAENRSIASLIRDAMASYIQTPSAPAESVESAVIRQVLPGPGKYNIYAEVREAE